jgi:hypothetical protein
MRLKDGSRFDCTVLTKRPDRAKTLTVQLVDGGAALCRMGKQHLTRVMTTVWSGSKPAS